MDLISRQGAIDALKAWEEDSFWDDECLKHRGEPYWVAPSDVIEHLPSVDASLMQDRCKIDASSDLISRQDAIKALTESNLKSHMDSVEGGQENRSAIRIIMELPSAEPFTEEELQKIADLEQVQFQKMFELGVEEGKASAQRKGKWIHYDEGDFDYDYKCSLCGYAVWDNSDYCPNCGADMRGEEDV